MSEMEEYSKATNKAIELTGNKLIKIKNIMEEEMVTISKKEYEELLEESAWLRALEAAGVDNWEGYDIAKDYLEDENSKTNI